MNKNLEELAELKFKTLLKDKDKWRKGKLGEFGEFKNGINYSRDENGDTDFKIVNVRNIVEKPYIYKEGLEIIKIDYKKAKTYLLQENDILIVRSASPGTTAIISENIENLIFSGFTIKFSPFDKLFTNYIFFQMRNISKNLSFISNGTTLQSINQETLKNYEIQIPEKEVIYEFNKVFEPIKAKIKYNFSQSRTLATYRDSILPKLMSGAIEI